MEEEDSSRMDSQRERGYELLKVEGPAKNFVESCGCACRFLNYPPANELMAIREHDGVVE